ncbi:MAG: hypothetical protein AB1439_11665 [candidate division FCPU426 bacterium]
MAKRRRQEAKDVQQELDLAEHAARLRALPGTPWEALRTLAVWVAAGILMFALAWLALGR